ncbi:cytochrome c [Paenibacillus tarimensis]
MKSVIEGVLLGAALIGLLSACAKSDMLDGPESTMKVFRGQCIQCHGADLKGRAGKQSNLLHVGSRMNADQIRLVIEQGGTIMPPFAEKLTEQEIEELAAWLAEKK